MPRPLGPTAGLLVMAMLAGAAATAAAQGRAAVLVIHTYGHDVPGRYPFDHAFAKALREAPGVGIDLYVEALDPNRFRGHDQQVVREHLRTKYAGRRLAAVVAVYGLALDWVADTKEPPFPGVPIVATLTRRPEHVPDNVAFTWSGNAISATLGAALKLLPQARGIVVIDGGPVRSARDVLGTEIASQVESVQSGLPVDFLRDLPIDQVLARVRALPAETIILMTRQFLGRDGAPIAALDAFTEVARAAAAPVFVTTDQQIGTGAVGGVVIDLGIVGADVAALTMRVVAAGSAGNIAPIEDRLSPIFDWRALRRWNISEANLPAGSTVLFREATLWDQYRYYIIGAIAIVVLQTALIGGLVVARIRRRRTETALRQSYDRNRNLAGRLINAQELERARLARDLHDDVSQQLAGLAIMTSGLRQKMGQPGPGAEIDESLRTIQDQTATLARSVRDLSHELHPEVLKHAGLVATLQRHCAQLSRQHGMPVSFNAADDIGGLSQATALCLFRVAQEALTNAVRYAKATTIAVDLAAGAGYVELRVQDDGIGFDATEGSSSGLGLRSIDERVRLADGEARIESQPGAGTVVRARVPLEQAAEKRSLKSEVTSNKGEAV